MPLCEWMNEWSRCAVVYYIHWSAPDTRGDSAICRLNEDIIHKQHLQNYSESHFTSFYRFLWVKPASYHIHTELEKYHGNPSNKSSFLLKHLPECIRPLFVELYVLLHCWMKLIQLKVKLKWNKRENNYRACQWYKITLMWLYQHSPPIVSRFG